MADSTRAFGAFNVGTALAQQRYARRTNLPAIIPMAFSYIFGVMPVGILAGLFIFPHTVRWSWWLVVLLLIGGFSMAIAVSGSFIAARSLSIATNKTIGKVTTVVVIVLGWLVLHETLNTHQVIGAGILLGAALIAARTPRAGTSPGRYSRRGPVMIALVSALAAGVSLVSEKALLGHMDVGGVFLIGWTAQSVAMLVLAGPYIRKSIVSQIYRYESRRACTMGLLNGLGGLFYVYTIYHSDNISLISAISSITLPLTAIGGYVLLRERENMKLLWLGLSVSLIGLLVIALA